MSTSCPFLSINDGSTDRSGEIAEKFASSHSCIKLFHQPNQGLSAARNKGLYICMTILFL